MKFLVAIALIATVASATPVRPIGQLLEAISALRPPTVAAGPAILEPNPIAVGPAIVDFPLPEGALVGAPIAPSPVSIIDGPAPVSDASSTPLVQIILNINQASAELIPVGPVIAPEPVHVVESAPEPVQVVETAPIPVAPVQVVEVAPEPVQVVEVAPAPAEPVIIGVPVIPSPAITLPEELN
ncbi:actin cytoskeleton-regulatory complex protein PAN1-like [Trichoplusia ni]|uniref:Actin cytoskeleton-regulatory complex protein PAN1-like n=1 Tax=Trichoplusia ni TaxID=7111 RepID=A0A7E5WRF0_TRINI|nr:actin cytoskeleton-regulatory complex protein PAN1-like [Trichoplusia ni]